jgi:ribosomal protein S18 acetylase RimI-like enzyme
MTSITPQSTEAERLHEALCAAWVRLADAMEGARCERRPGYLWAVFPQMPVPSFNGVWPDDDSAASALEGALAEIATLGVPYSMQTRPGRTPAWDDEAERLGLMVREEEPAMLLLRDELREVAAPELELVKVETADGLAQALAVAAEGFGVPADLFVPLYDLEVAQIDGVAYYLGRVGREDVTTGVGLTVGDAVGVFSVATRPEHRGRGYGAAITVEAVREGFRSGAKFAWLQASPSGHRVYRRLGFRDVDTYVLRVAPEAPVEALKLA